MIDELAVLLGGRRVATLSQGKAGVLTLSGYWNAGPGTFKSHPPILSPSWPMSVRTAPEQCSLCAPNSYLLCSPERAESYL